MRGMCLLAGMLLACGPGETGKGNDGGGGDGDDATIGNAGVCTNMDILFVIDDSESMEEEQANLIQNFPAFADLLANYTNPDGDKIDFRIGVTTTSRSMRIILNPNAPGAPVQVPNIPIDSKGDDGALRDGCGLTNNWVEGSDPGLQSKFSCVANVGIGGQGVEMPLLMSEWAIKDRVADGANANFLRDDALLGLVYITDENDCSRTDDNFEIGFTNDPCGDSPFGPEPELEPVDRTIAALDAAKGARERWAAAIIAGLSDCSSSLGDATKSERMIEFAGKAGSNVRLTSICQGDLTAPLKEALDTFTAACAAFPPID